MAPGDTRLDSEVTALEKILGVNVDMELKFSQHIEKQVSKTNKILGLLRSFESLDTESMKKLCTALIRPRVEFSNVAWATRREKDQKLIGVVQK